MREENCIFCKLANGEISSKTIYEDEECRAILDLSPATKGHALIIPKEHYPNIYELPGDTAGILFKAAQKCAVQMKKALQYEGLNIVQNNGEIAGQTVFHFHIHLIPRYHGDDQFIGWKPGAPSQEELEEVKNTIIG